MTNNEIEEKLIKDAVSEYEQNNFTSSHQYFEKYLNLGKELSEENLMIYFKAKLKSLNPNIDFGELNPYLIRFNTIYQSYSNKYHFNLNNTKNTNTNVEFKAIEYTEDEIRTYRLDILYPGNHIILAGKNKDKTMQEYIDSKPPHTFLKNIINRYSFAIYPQYFLKENVINDYHYLEALEINIIKIEIINYRNECLFEFRDEFGDDDFEEQNFPNYEQWLREEYGDDAETAYWNLD